MYSILLGLLLSLNSPSQPRPTSHTSWITSTDYPADALRQGRSGEVGYRLKIDSRGTVRSCKVTQTSGTTSLDRKTCELLKGRAHFLAATGGDGRTTSSTYENLVRWVLPTPPVMTIPVTVLSRNPFGLLPARPSGLTRWQPLPQPVLEADIPSVAVPVEDDVVLPGDPMLREGKLPNGLRYMVLRNALPRGSVSIRMRIGAGSLDETDTQRGYAHLLEHMVMRGTAHVADGDFMRSLEQLGLRLGTDSNAHTMAEDTTYELDFPTGKASADINGLFLLREVASRAVLASAALDAERGIVTAESRTRDTAIQREQKARVDFLLAGQRVPTRWTGGTDASIGSATVTGLRTFYDAHYRPDKTTIIVVGDIDPERVVSDIQADFADWRATGPSLPQPDEGGVQHRGRSIKLFTENDAPSLIEADRVSPFDAEPDTIRHQRRILARAIAAAILDTRLSRIAQRPDAPFSNAEMTTGALYHSAMVTTLAVIPVAGRYPEALATARIEQRRLVESGVTQTELNRVVARMRASDTQSLAQSGTRNTVDLANGLLASVDAGTVFTSPAQTAADLDKILASITIADVRAAAAEMASGSGPLLFASSNRPIAGGAAAITNAFAAADAKPLAATTAPVASAWPYTNFGAPGRIIDRRDIADLGVTIVRFGNGTSVTIKSVPQPKDDILVDLDFGAGFSGLPAGHEATDWMAATGGSLFVQGGLAKADAADIAEQLSGKVASAQFAVSDDRFHLLGHTRDEDIETQLQLLTAYVADPGFRPASLRREKALLQSILPQVEASSTLVAGRDLRPILHDGDPRWSVLPDAAELASAQPGDLAALLRPSLDGPLNLVLVGDMSVDKAIAAAQATIGALPPRGPRPASSDARFPAASGKLIRIADHDRSDRAVAFVAWPTTGFFASTADARSMQVLADIVQSRLIDGLRARDGLTYAPTVYTDQSEISATYGMIAARVEIAPAKADQFFAEMHSIVTDLAARLVSIEELDRARTPMLDASRAQLLFTNYWLGELPRADEDARLFDTIRTRVPDLMAVKPADIQRLAQHFLVARIPLRVLIESDAATRSDSVQKPSAISGSNRR